MHRTIDRRKGFTLTELLVVIVIILCLAALGFFVLSKARESARRGTSAANLRQFGVAITSFVMDNDGYLPASRSSKGVYWPQIVWPYIESLDPYLIPGTPDRPMDPKVANGEGYFPMGDTASITPWKQPIRWNYAINGGHSKLPFAELADDGKALPGVGNGWSRPFSQITDPNRTIMLVEGTSWWLNGEAKAGSNRIRTWSNKVANVLWCDGSVRQMNPKRELRNQDFIAVK
jgi:prepilin-type N-terminal cleavage/methylation domain-containing protein/prepilin-type processing-associated H-X9-DG protein